LWLLAINANAKYFNQTEEKKREFTFIDITQTSRLKKREVKSLWGQKGYEGGTHRKTLQGGIGR